VGVLLTLAGCGGDEENPDPEPSARERQDSNARIAPREDRPPAARSDRECLELWNSEVEPGTAGQKSTSDFVADIASKHPVKALARHHKGNCLVVVPFEPGANAAWTFVALEGRAPFNHPGRIRLPPGRVLASNTRTNPDGTLR
jgi:hypothetical protein